MAHQPQSFKNKTNIVKKTDEIRKDDVVELLAAEIELFGRHLKETQVRIFAGREPDHFFRDVHAHAGRRLQSGQEVSGAAPYFEDTGTRGHVVAGDGFQRRVVAPVAPLPPLHMRRVVLKEPAAVVELF